MIPQIHLRRGKEESLLRRHPWIFSGAIESVRYDGNEIPEGALVDVYTRSGDFIARGHYQIGSIAVRVLTFEQEPIDAAWWQRMISTALDVRRTLGLTDAPDTTCYRLVHGEGALPAGTRRRYLRHDRRDSMSLGGHVPRPPDNRRCDPNGLRRPDHRHLRQKFPNRTVQGRPESRGRGTLYGKNGRNAPTRARKRRKNSWSTGKRARRRASLSTSASTANWYAATPEDARSSIPSATRADFRYMLLRAEHAKYARSTPRSGPSPWPTPTFGSTSEKRLPTLRWPSMPSNTSRTSATGTT